MDITQLKGVGAVTANNLNRLSVYTVEDLVKLYPRDYDVYEEPVFISSIDDDTEIAAIEGTVVGSPDIYGNGRLKMLSVIIKDLEGGAIKCVWYNMLFLKASLRIGTHYVFRGKVNHKKDSYILEQPQMYTMAQYNEVKGQLMPIYPLTKGLSNKTVVKAVTQALDKYKIGLENVY